MQKNYPPCSLGVSPKERKGCYCKYNAKQKSVYLKYFQVGFYVDLRVVNKGTDIETCKVSLNTVRRKMTFFMFKKAKLPERERGKYRKHVYHYVMGMLRNKIL